MTANYKHLIIEKRDKLLIVRINNPRKRNALDRQAYADITTVLTDASKDDSIFAVAFTGVGDFYTSGNDLSKSTVLGDGSGNFDDFLEKAKQGVVDFIRAFLEFPKLLIAVVNGPCLGIGATTAALCDIIYCTENAYFQTPFTALGLCPEGCSSYTFPKILGTSKATEILLLNCKLTAQEALRYNFVSEVFKKTDLETKLWPKILEFSKLPPGSFTVGKELVKKFEKDRLEQTLIAEANAIHQRWYSDECINAILAFQMKKSKL